jgi:hypothetical protein
MTTQTVATSGWSATIQPITPPLAIRIITISGGVRPPSPRRIDRPKMTPVRAAWVAAMIRLHDAPSAYCDRVTTTASTPQISHVPRCGRVAPRRVSRA